MTIERERVWLRKISCKEDDWFVDGEIVSGFILHDQRGYSKEEQHLNGSYWSRPVDGYSENSLQGDW